MAKWWKYTNKVIVVIGASAQSFDEEPLMWPTWH